MTRPRGMAHPSRLAAAATAYAVPIMVGGWTIATLLSLRDAPGVPQVTAVAAIVSLTAMSVKPELVCVGLPFFALLSPIGGFVAGRLLWSDLLFLLLIAQCACLLLYGRIGFARSPATLIGTALALLYVLATAVGGLTGTLVSMKPLVYVVQLVIIGVYTTVYARDEHAWSRLINAWIGAALLGAAIAINAFVTGRRLSGFDQAADTTIDRSSIAYLFRADYYYTGFHYVVGIAIVILICRQLFTRAPGSRLPSLAALLILVTSLAMMLNRTAIASCAVAIVTVCLVLIRQIPRRTLAYGALFGLIGGATGYALVSHLFLDYLGGAQADLYSTSATGLSSFFTRLGIYQRAFGEWLIRPIQMVLGLGPDFLDRSGAPDLAALFKVSASTGIAENTVDSGWISFMMELGLVGFAVLVAWLALSLRDAVRRLRALRADAIGQSAALAVFGGLIYTFVAMGTQMLGYTKITWFPFQLVLIGLLQCRHATCAES